MVRYNRIKWLATNALPLSYKDKDIMPLTGFEPATLSLIEVSLLWTVTKLILSGIDEKEWVSLTVKYSFSGPRQN